MCQRLKAEAWAEMGPLLHQALAAHNKSIHTGNLLWQDRHGEGGCIGVLGENRKKKRVWGNLASSTLKKKKLQERK